MFFRGILTAFAAIAIALPLAGCPAPCVDEQTSKQNNAMGSQAMVILLQAAGDAVMKDLSGSQMDTAKQGEAAVPYEKTIDFDGVDGEGNDLFPNVSGEVEVFGEAQIARTPYGFTFESIPLFLITLTEVEVYFPELETALRIPEEMAMACRAEGEIKLYDGGREGDEPRSFDAWIGFWCNTQQTYTLQRYDMYNSNVSSHIAAKVHRPNLDPTEVLFYFDGPCKVGSHDDDINGGPPAHLQYEIQLSVAAAARNGAFGLPLSLGTLFIQASNEQAQPHVLLRYQPSGGEIEIINLGDFVSDTGVNPLPLFEGPVPLLPLNPQAALDVTSAGAQAIVLIENLTFEALTQEAQGWVLKDGEKVAHEIDRTFDLDAQDGEGNDLYPNATGSFRIQGTADVGLPLDGSRDFTIDELGVTVEHPIEITNPAGAAIALPTPSGFWFEASGSIRTGIELRIETTLTKHVNNLSMVWRHVSNSGSDAFHATGSVDYDYLDRNPADDEAGNVQSAKWDQDFAFRHTSAGETHTYRFIVWGDLRPGASGAIWYVVLDNRVYGPFTESDPFA